MPQTLGLGATGEDVILLQTRLNALPSARARLVVDGTFGRKTLLRVKEYQTKTFVTGLVDDGTWAKLLDDGQPQHETFYIEGRHLHAPNGAKVILRGVNKMSVFEQPADAQGQISFPEIKQTAANSVRIVWAIATDQGPTAIATLDALITNAKANHLIPMVELHDATGDRTRLGELVNYWTQPAVVDILKKHEAYLLINIGNEVGDDTVSQADFVAGYNDAVQRLRAAGIRSPLVIDASDWGKDLGMLNNTAAVLLAADPEANLIFSVHLYWPMADGADAAFIRTNLQQAVNLGYPLVVGEFSRYGAFSQNNPAADKCGPTGEIDYQTILDVCHELELGWYAWEWGPGNDFNDPLCAVMDMTPDRTFANLKQGWAFEVAISSPFGIQQTSVTPASI